MNLRTRIAAVLSVLALAAGLTVAAAVPASALTERQISDEEYGLSLESCSALYDTVYFGDGGGCYNIWWDFQAEGSAGGDGTYYYLHPHGYDSLCMTASTTDWGLIKIEACDGVSQQYWWDPNDGQGDYEIYNAYWGAFLADPVGGEAGLSSYCDYETYDCTFLQTPLADIASRTA
jgi:hypothetical protein